MYAAVTGGWVEVICGGMFSGKSEELIRRIKRAQFANQQVAIFKPMLDNRYSESDVVSHNGNAVCAKIVESSVQIDELIPANTSVIAIDEAQFFDERLIMKASEWADQGYRVIIAGLDQDFRGRPFGPMPELLAIAEHITKLQAVCVVCGSPASRTQRLINGKPAAADEPTILVGASESYEARCRNHHEVPVVQASSLLQGNSGL